MKEKRFPKNFIFLREKLGLPPVSLVNEKTCRCGRLLTPENNCGGDCTQCMADAGDPECIEAVRPPLTFERQYPQEAQKMMDFFAAGWFIHTFINLRGGCNPFEVFNYRETLGR